MNHAPTPWKARLKQGMTFEFQDEKNGNYLFEAKGIGSVHAEFIVTACNVHEEAMELLERVTIELQRRIVSGGMETNVAESLGLDELLVDIEQALAKAGIKPN